MSASTPSIVTIWLVLRTRTKSQEVRSHHSSTYVFTLGFFEILNWFHFILPPFKALNGLGAKYLPDLLTWYVPCQPLSYVNGVLLVPPMSQLVTKGDSCCCLSLQAQDTIYSDCSQLLDVISFIVLISSVPKSCRWYLVFCFKDILLNIINQSVQTAYSFSLSWIIPSSDSSEALVSFAMGVNRSPI